MTTRFYGFLPKLHIDRNAVSVFDIGPQLFHLFFLLGMEAVKLPYTWIFTFWERATELII